MCSFAVSFFRLLLELGNTFVAATALRSTNVFLCGTNALSEFMPGTMQAEVVASDTRELSCIVAP